MQYMVSAPTFRGGGGGGKSADPDPAFPSPSLIAFVNYLLNFLRQVLLSAYLCLCVSSDDWPFQSGGVEIQPRARRWKGKVVRRETGVCRLRLLSGGKLRGEIQRQRYAPEVTEAHHSSIDQFN